MVPAFTVTVTEPEASAVHTALEPIPEVTPIKL
jgi:hypothetical protein